MKKFVNDRKNLVPEMIEGFMLAYGNTYRKLEGRNGILLREQKEKVSIVTGGGSGGEPWCIGSVGVGYADGVAVGNVFAAPSAITVAEVCREVYHEKGVLLITGNHAGDRMNFELAVEILEMNADIRCETVLVTDNMATSEVREERSGLAGCDIVVQVAAAAALEGMDLNGVKQIAEKVNANLSSLSATMELGENPATEKPMGSIGENEVHIGIGVTGEPAMKIIPMCTAKQISGVLMDLLADDLSLGQGDEVAVYINGGGTVTVMEELIMCREILTNLSQRGIRAFDVNLVERIKVDKTNSITVSILKLDSELKKYIAYPARSPLVFKHHF